MLVFDKLSLYEQNNKINYIITLAIGRGLNFQVRTYKYSGYFTC